MSVMNVMSNRSFMSTGNNKNFISSPPLIAP